MHFLKSHFFRRARPPEFDPPQKRSVPDVENDTVLKVVNFRGQKDLAPPGSSERISENTMILKSDLFVIFANRTLFSHGLRD